MNSNPLFSSKSNEWYTPKSIINLVKLFLDGIDIDPASNTYSQQWINAKTYFTKEDDGFSYPWYGKLFLNPPYGTKSKKDNNYGASAWLFKALNEYEENRVSEGIILARGDSDGIRTLMKKFVFIDCDRISFVTREGVQRKPVPGSKLIYLGSRERLFLHRFETLGIPLRKVNV